MSRREAQGSASGGRSERAGASPDVYHELVSEAVEELLPLMTRLARLHVSGDAEVGVVIERAWADALAPVAPAAPGPTDDDHTSLRVRAVRAMLRCLAGRAGPGCPNGRRPPAVVDAERFLPPSHPTWPGHWARAPRPPHELPMSAPGTPAMWDFVRTTVLALPTPEAEILLLRDVERWKATEVCETLMVSDVVQRALLQSARERVRQALEDYPGRN